jgi:hypothetical protein
MNFQEQVLAICPDAKVIRPDFARTEKLSFCHHPARDHEPDLVSAYSRRGGGQVIGEGRTVREALDDLREQLHTRLQDTETRLKEIP